MQELAIEIFDLTFVSGIKIIRKQNKKAKEGLPLQAGGRDVE